MVLGLDTIVLTRDEGLDLLATVEADVAAVPPPPALTMSRPTSTSKSRGAAELLRVPEVARRTGLTIREVYARIDEGSLPAFRDADGLAVVPSTAVDELID